MEQWLARGEESFEEKKNENSDFNLWKYFFKS